MEQHVQHISEIFSCLFSCLEQSDGFAEAEASLAELSRILQSSEVDTVKLARFSDLSEKLDMLLDTVHCENGASLALAAVEASSRVCAPPVGHATQSALRFAALCQNETQLRCCAHVLKASTDAFEANRISLKGVLEGGACRVAHRVMLFAASYCSQECSSTSMPASASVQRSTFTSTVTTCLNFITVILRGANGCAADAAARLVALDTPCFMSDIVELCGKEGHPTLECSMDRGISGDSIGAAILETLLCLAFASADGCKAVGAQEATVNIAAAGAMSLEITAPAGDLHFDSTACALVGCLLTSKASTAAQLLNAAEHWAVQFSMRLDAAVRRLQGSHLNETAQQQGLAVLQRVVADMDAGSAESWLPVLLQAAAGGVLHEVSRCLNNLDEEIMLAAVLTMQKILVVSLVPGVSQRTALRAWQQMTREGIVPALVACTADYNTDIKAGAFACLNLIVRFAAQHWAVTHQGRSLLSTLGEEGVLNVATRELQHWNEGRGDFGSALDGVNMLTVFASTEEQGGLSPTKAVALVAELTLCIVRSAHKCWKMSQRERRWRRQHADVLRAQTDDAGLSIQRVRRRSRGYSSSPVSPGRASARPGSGASEAASSTSSSDGEDDTCEVSGQDPNAMMAAAALVLGNCFLFRPELRLHALNCGLLPVLLRLLQGYYCSAMYNCGRRRCLLDEVGFLGGSQSAGSPTSTWQPLVDTQSGSALAADPAWSAAAKLMPTDDWHWALQRATAVRDTVAASEDKGGMIFPSSGPDRSDDTIVNVLTCLTNLCADCPAAKTQMRVASLYNLLQATSADQKQHVKMLSCLLLTHLHVSLVPGFAEGSGLAEFHSDQVHCTLLLLAAGHQQVETARSIWASTPSSSSRPQLARSCNRSVTAASLESYLHDVTGVGFAGLVQPAAATYSHHENPLQSAQCQAAALSCIANYIVPNSERLHAALRLNLVQQLLAVLSDHSLRLEQGLDDSTFQSSQQIVSMCLHAVHSILNIVGTVAIVQAATGPLIAALVQLISNDEGDEIAKRSFLLLQMFEQEAVHNLLDSMMDVCASLGTRQTLPSSLIGPVLTACKSPHSTSSLSAQQATAARCWLEKALVVLNALVFTSDAATEWLTHQSQWHAGLAPLARVMVSNVGPAEVLSAALLATNLAMCQAMTIATEARSMQLVPLISYIFSSISVQESDSGEGEVADEVEEAKGILLQLAMLLMRGDSENTAAFVQHSEDGLRTVAQLARIEGDLAEMATEAFLELAEQAAKLAQSLAVGEQQLEASRPLLDAFQSGAYTPVLEIIASRASASVDAHAARAEQALRRIRQPLECAGVPHAGMSD